MPANTVTWRWGSVRGAVRNCTPAAAIGVYAAWKSSTWRKNPKLEAQSVRQEADSRVVLADHDGNEAEMRGASMGDRPCSGSTDAPGHVERPARSGPGEGWFLSCCLPCGDGFAVGQVQAMNSAIATYWHATAAQT